MALAAIEPLRRSRPVRICGQAVRAPMELFYRTNLLSRPASLTTELAGVALPDGRTLAYRVYGAPLVDTRDDPERVLLYFHGTPSCHMEALALEKAAEVLEVSILAFDRPGYGSSSLNRNLTPTQLARDCIYFMSSLGVDAAHVMGVSGESREGAG